MELLGRILITLAVAGFFSLFLILIFSGMSKWGGRSLSLLDPTYASKYIPIISSVSEHQATTWTSYFFDLHYLMVLMPIGFFFCCAGQTENTNYGKIFLVLYGILAIYFSCVMIRLMLVVAPCACVLAAIGASELIQRFTRIIRNSIKKWLRVRNT
jgi:dolichyl-diphosphooligosaccharide--protein glycosyltransferase